MGLNCGLRSSKAAIVALSPARGALPATMPCHARPESAARGTAFGLQAVGHGRWMEGADTPMLVLMRLIRSAARSLLLVRRRSPREASRSPGLGQPSPWQMGFQQSAAPTMDDIVWFHNFVLWIIIAITVFVLALLLDRDREVQRQGQSDAVEDHAQHAARSGLDRDPGGHPGGDRDPVVPHPVRAAQHSAVRPHHQGDRQPVELDLHLSGRQDRVHLDHADRTRNGRRSIRRRRGCSPSTTRSSCRSTRWCACR